MIHYILEFIISIQYSSDTPWICSTPRNLPMYLVAPSYLIAISLPIGGLVAGSKFPVSADALDRAHREAHCPPKPASPERQRALFHEFIDEFFVQRIVEKPMVLFTSEDYIQHNPFILSGRHNSIAALGPGGIYDFSAGNITLMQIIFESPYGMLHWKLEMPDQPPTALSDLWRFNGTCIEEHWDVIEALPANATNPLALF
jgi:predicted SnoaL-like aldol condensation-catalyzing enzyme